MSSFDVSGSLQFFPGEQEWESDVDLTDNKVWVEVYGEEYYPQVDFSYTDNTIVFKPSEGDDRVIKFTETVFSVLPAVDEAGNKLFINGMTAPYEGLDLDENHKKIHYLGGEREQGHEFSVVFYDLKTHKKKTYKMTEKSEEDFDDSEIETCHSGSSSSSDSESENLDVDDMMSFFNQEAARLSAESQTETAEATEEQPEIEPEDLSEDIAIGSVVRFGSYPQSSSDISDSILWDVLDIKDGKAFLFSHNILLAHRFSMESSDYYESKKWDESYDNANIYAGSGIRKWLNEDFYDKAFSDSEKERIETTEVITEGEQNTADKIFLLSEKEVTDPAYGFNGDCDADAFRKKKVTACVDTHWMNTFGIGYFLRDRSFLGEVRGIGADGSFKNLGICEDFGIVPGLWVKISECEKQQMPAEKSETSNLVKGKIIKFGTYKGNPIQWRVLSTDGHKALLLSEYILEKRRFDASNNYKNSEIRKYLNGEFLDNCFTDEEKTRILVTDVDNSARSTNPHNDPTKYNFGKNQYVCPNTKDKVFLLSVDEVTNPDYGFSEDDESDDSRTATDISGETDFYWLRSPSSFDRDCAWGVNGGGDIGSGGVFYANSGVRPALWIDLDR